MLFSTLVALVVVVGGQSQPIVDPAVRSAFFERILAPRDAPTVTPPAAGDRNQQRAFEAAEFHRRGLVFAQQGAWKEAESAFRDAERRNDKVPEYKLSAAYAYLRIHKPNDAYKRYEDFYKKDPSDARALVGMIAAREESQLYRDAAALWVRYTRMPLGDQDAVEAQALLLGARELFAQRYEIAENPTGGATNLATPEQELEWGLGYAKELAASGVPLLTDRAITSYVEQLSQRLVKHAKQFPTNYQLYVLDTAGVNATTVPGFIFVYRGLLEAAPSEAALVGVLAHEIGHSVAHHTAKKVTRSVQDDQQLANLKKSDSKLSQLLAKLLEAGNPVGAMSFSREAEAQADRLGVHITFDAGYDPNGLAEMFQIFEQMSPSSRSSWDLMARTHPFSIDRINAVREYSALLPSRPHKTSSPEFDDVKARLKALPPPPDATGMLIRATTYGAADPALPPAAAPPATGRIAFTVDSPPYAGEMPEGWVAKKNEQGVTIIEGRPGTEPYEMTIRVAFYDKSGNSLDGILGELQQAMTKLPESTLTETDLTKTSEGRPARAVVADYTGQNVSNTAVAFRQVMAIVEYQGHFVVIGYSGPTSLFDKYIAAFEMVGTTLAPRR